MGGTFHLPSLGAIDFAEKEIYVLNFSWYLTRLSSQRVMWLNVWFSVTMRHHPANSSGIGLVEEDIKFSIWHAASYDLMIRTVRIHYELCLTICQHSAKFGGHTSSGRRNVLFLVCHVTSCDQVVRERCDFMVHSPHRK